ncbi:MULTISPECIES: oxygenase MpaB family protein [unclassified Kribbella]|uniref:oxygenase MpaB family protein n=1 Tax=unclassified Kribbella TaxID=2644121 RepID=UPI00340C9CB8
MAATIAGPLDPLRDGLARMIMTKVAGPDPAAERSRVHNTPGPRWFEPDRPIRRVHGDAAMFAGGLRALLLQSLHPLAMAAVSAHSGYRGDPWGRLRRTSYFLAITTYGAVPDAEEAIARVKGVHERVRGTSPDGVKYRASDPHLLKWVHVAEVDSFLAAHQTYGVQPLDAAEQDLYVEDAALVARKLGVIDPPTTVAELRELLDEYRPELRGTTEARQAARFMLIHPPVPMVARPAYGVLTAAAVGLLPWWTRWPLRLPYLPLAEATVVRAAGEGLTRTIRWALTSPILGNIEA